LPGTQIHGHYIHHQQQQQQQQQHVTKVLESGHARANKVN
jgi:hypothetical protein